MRFIQRFCSLILIGLLPMSLVFADGWVNFHSGIPEDPQINLLESSGSHVKYEIILPGMWVRTVTEGDSIYQLIETAKCLKDETPGVPSLPRIPVNIAVPTGCSIDVVVTKERTFYWKATKWRLFLK
jgi:hypothetical protein